MKEVKTRDQRRDCTKLLVNSVKVLLSITEAQTRAKKGELKQEVSEELTHHLRELQVSTKLSCFAV